ERMSDLGDAALILKEIAAEKPAAPIAPLDVKSSKSWIAAAVLAAVGLAAGFAFGRRTGDASPATAAAPIAFKQLTFVPGGEGEPAISPDGQSFAYVAGPMGHGDIFVQRIDGRNAVNVTASCKDDDREPAFSPDGRLIAYVSKCNGGGLFVMGATGESS